MIGGVESSLPKVILELRAERVAFLGTFTPRDLSTARHKAWVPKHPENALSRRHSIWKVECEDHRSAVPVLVAISSTSPGPRNRGW